MLRYDLFKRSAYFTIINTTNVDINYTLLKMSGKALFFFFLGDLNI